MRTLKRISKVFASATEISFDDSSKIILMSDCHRGDGGWTDNFSNNQNLFYTALKHYYKENYTYIELGDGDELWENYRLTDVTDAHPDVFLLLSKFYDRGQLYFIFGNHDMVKKDKGFVKNNLPLDFAEGKKSYLSFLKKVGIHESLVLHNKVTRQKIFLFHGHQVDLLNYDYWKIARFLVRFLWRPLELIGINDPTSTANNHNKKILIEKIFSQWAKENSRVLIAGHTHRIAFPEAGEPLYFNTGCSVYPHFITGIEISEGSIQLVKWSVKTKDNGTLFIEREVLAGPRKIADL